MVTDLLAHFLRQLSPENRRWLETRPADTQQAIAEEWRETEGAGASLLSSVDLVPDLVDEGASANAFIQNVRDAENW
ncbi:MULTISPECIES: hypothetical protein [unclassified Streptomyces]|uniref:Uncharacterized protein n=1 Tax=Streptomyces johnsoniae TaxID=3075532 RepID=A0ABU2SAT5_9ACTN|nr:MULTISPECIES: hypothetical protein [unclassified Streptomyces]MDT0445220.1 hypothetical protein [Streptomyces sp. DSM 41886]ONK12400.1 hypothetical protein STBA_31420 [Streptomyces sp. MP131-18]